ncbi:MAG TPA: hypothetical protein VFN02_11655 [Ktedonobacteraceae bacterium]|nr:hypothetical protein [Ktedonobacteraceae bacterium]
MRPSLWQPSNLVVEQLRNAPAPVRRFHDLNRAKSSNGIDYKDSVQVGP